MPLELLLVEDDAGIRSLTAMALEAEGHRVTEADSAETALELLAGRAADLILIDLMLPGMDGFDLCRTIRKTSDVPIVVLTAKADTHDVVAGLEAGADDYLTKPFVVKELAARIRALLRRGRDLTGSIETLHFGDLDIAPSAGTVTRAGTAVELTKTEYLLLCELALNAGIVMSREHLLEHVWGYDYLGDGRLVDAHIRRLRTKIETEPAEPTFIVTVRGLGYRFQKP